MPKLKNVKNDITKCKHPNSRKTIALVKQMKKSSNREKQKKQQFQKQNIIGEKVAWFRDNLLEDVNAYSLEEAKKLIEKYLGRFDEELEQIILKHSIGGRKNRQHASREDIIRLTKKNELEEYKTCGIEMPNILDPKELTILRNWTGELRFLQNIKLVRIGKNKLKSRSKRNKTNADNQKVHSNLLIEENCSDHKLETEDTSEIGQLNEEIVENATSLLEENVEMVEINVKNIENTASLTEENVDMEELSVKNNENVTSVIEKNETMDPSVKNIEGTQIQSEEMVVDS